MVVFIINRTWTCFGVILLFLLSKSTLSSCSSSSSILWSPLLLFTFIIGFNCPVCYRSCFSIFFLFFSWFDCPFCYRTPDNIIPVMSMYMCECVYVPLEFLTAILAFNVGLGTNFIMAFKCCCNSNNHKILYFKYVSKGISFVRAVTTRRPYSMYGLWWLLPCVKFNYGLVLLLHCKDFLTRAFFFVCLL